MFLGHRTRVHFILILCIWTYSAVPRIWYYKEHPIKIGSHVCVTKWRPGLSTSSHIQIIPYWKPNVGYVFFCLKYCAPRKKVFKSINSMIKGTDLDNLAKWCYEMGSKLEPI